MHNSLSWFLLCAAATIVLKPSPLDSQVEADRVRGRDLVAAVNLHAEDLKADGRLFVPDKVTHARTVLVVINWGIGESIYGDPQIRKLVEANGCVLLLARISAITTTELDNRPVPNAAGRNALLKLLQRFAQESKHEELRDAPLLFWGHSRAGPVGTSFAEAYPERTVAFIRYHSGPNPTGDLRGATRVPALFMVGGKDTIGDNPGANSLWSRGRSGGAPWTWSFDPDADHGSLDSLRKGHAVLIPWVTSVLQQRLARAGTSLLPVSDASAWAGTVATGEIAPLATVRKPALDVSWLPDEPSARAWRALMGVAR